MGLDVSFRFRRKDAEKIGEDCGRPIYKESDMYLCETSFCGRSAFNCIRKWVGDDRYGTFIPLDDENYDTLCMTISDALANDNILMSENDIFEALDNGKINPFSLADLYAFVIKNKVIADKLGWYLEIECDW